ncbi:hypothetical protein FAIPA1_150056 [Frankia sp. AiPs1]
MLVSSHEVAFPSPVPIADKRCRAAAHGRAPRRLDGPRASTDPPGESLPTAPGSHLGMPGRGPGSAPCGRSR